MVADKTTAERKKERREALFRRHFHSEERVEFIGHLPCELTGARHPGVIHNAHTKTRGSGGTYKDIVPLYWRAHKDFDEELSNEEFARMYGRTKQSVRDRAPHYQQLWLDSQES